MIEKHSVKEFGTRFFTLGARLAFAKLMHAFSTTLILPNFDPKCLIQIEIDALDYGISKILS